MVFVPKVIPETRLEKAEAELGRIFHVPIMSGNKLSRPVLRARKFLFQKRREICQTDWKSWPQQAWHLYRSLLKHIQKGFAFMNEARKELDLNRKLNLLKSSREEVRFAAEADNQIRHILIEQHYTLALHKLK
jgi:hypothetical protein